MSIKFIDEEMFNNEKGVSVLTCNLDKGNYFEMVGIVKELGYKDMCTIWYNYPIYGMNMLTDNIGSQTNVGLYKSHLNVK